jgi:hypothetical protein
MMLSSCIYFSSCNSTQGNANPHINPNISSNAVIRIEITASPYQFYDRKKYQPCILENPSQIRHLINSFNDSKPGMIKYISELYFKLTFKSGESINIGYYSDYIYVDRDYIGSDKFARSGLYALKRPLEIKRYCEFKPEG